MDKIKQILVTAKGFYQQYTKITRKVFGIVWYALCAPLRAWKRFDAFMFRIGPKFQFPIFIGAVGYGSYLTYFS